MRITGEHNRREFQSARRLVQERDSEREQPLVDIRRELLPYRAQLEQVLERTKPEGDMRTPLQMAADMVILFPEYIPPFQSELLQGAGERITTLFNKFCAFDEEYRLPEMRGALGEICKCIKQCLILFPGQLHRILDPETLKEIQRRGEELLDSESKEKKTNGVEESWLLECFSAFAMAFPDQQGRLSVYTHRDFMLPFFSDVEREKYEDFDKARLESGYIAIRHLFPEEHKKLPYAKVVGDIHERLKTYQERKGGLDIFYTAFAILNDAASIAQLTAERISVDASGFHLDYSKPHTGSTSLPPRSIV